MNSKYEIIKVDFPTGKIVNERTLVTKYEPIKYYKKVSRFKRIITSLYIYGKLKFNKNIFESKDILKEASVVYIGGGNMLMDLSQIPDYSIRFFNYIKTINNYHLPIHLIFVGVGPVQNYFQRRYIRKASQLCKTIIARDDASRIELISYGVKKQISILPDPAFLFPYEESTSIKRNVIAVNVYIYRNEKSIYNSYVDLVKYISFKYSSKTIVLFSTESMDYPNIDKILSECNTFNCKNLYVKYIYSISDLLKLYHSSICIISTRMHSAIIALSQRVPVIPIVWQKKIVGMFNYMELGITLYSQKDISNNIENVCNDIERYLVDDEFRIKIDKQVKRIQDTIRKGVIENDAYTYNA